MENNEIITKWKRSGLLDDMPENKKDIIANTFEETEKFITSLEPHRSDVYIFPAIRMLMIKHKIFKIDIKHLQLELKIWSDKWEEDGLFDENRKFGDDIMDEFLDNQLCDINKNDTNIDHIEIIGDNKNSENDYEDDEHGKRIDLEADLIAMFCYVYAQKIEKTYKN